MKHYIFSLLLLLSSQAVHTQQVTFYDGLNYTGNSKSFPLTSAVTYIGDDFNDKPRSVRVPTGYICTMYAANVGTGTTRSVNWSYPNLISMGLDYAVSNFKFVKITTPMIGTIYQSRDYTGAGKFIYAGYKYRLYDGSDLNDAVSSIKLQPNYALKVWVDAVNNSNLDDTNGGQGRGKSVILDTGISDLSTVDMEDKISFIEVISRPNNNASGNTELSDWYNADLGKHVQIRCRYKVVEKGKIKLEIKSTVYCNVEITAKICSGTSPDDRNGWEKLSLQPGVIETLTIEESSDNCRDGFWWWIRNFKNTGVSID